MIAKTFLFAALATVVCQAQDVVLKIVGGEKQAIAIPEFRGAGDAAAHMNAFNQVLISDLEDSGLFRILPRTLYPLVVPQQPSDFRETGSPRLGEWSSPPASARYLAFGYAASQNNQIVLSGWLFDVGQTSVAAAQTIGKRYFAPVSESGARKVAHEFAADIIAKFGGESLLGSHIYFVSDRSGHKEIWSMDFDGANQRQITKYNSITTMPAVSPDGTKLAFVSYAEFYPKVFVWSLENGRRLRFDNPRGDPTVGGPSFSADGKQILFAHSGSGWMSIYKAELEGRNAVGLATGRRIETEPKASPKSGSELVFVSGASRQPQQIWRMSIDGTNREMLTNGQGQAGNPAWHPKGEIIALSWTGGLAAGNLNIFLMDVATRRVDQVTHGAGRNENPSWAPDGRHLVFASSRNGRMQIFTMLADGTGVRQLTTAGRNEMPVWGK